MGTRGLAALGAIVGLLLLAYAFVPGYGSQYTAFEHTHVLLHDETPDVNVTSVQYIDAKGKTIPLTFDRREEDGTIWIDLEDVGPSPTKPRRLFYRVEVIREGGTVEPHALQVLSHDVGLVAALGALLAVFCGPLVLIRTSRLQVREGNRLTPVTGWTYLLVEPNTGLSLARLQLLLLFVPTAVVYIALAVPLHEFPPVSDSVWQLLGIGGASAALSTLITPSKPAGSGGPQPPGGEPAQPAPEDPTGLAGQALSQVAAATMPAPAPAPAVVEIQPPALTDLFADSNGYGDMSRYQSLVMCITTAAVFFVSFFDDWVVPDIPDQMLQLLGTSLAVYLGVKGITLVKKDAAAK